MGWRGRDSPEYAGRSFEIDKNQITFGTGEMNAAMHPILKIEIDHKGQETLYDIYYVNPEGQEYKLSFYYIPARGTIRFKNQLGIEWTRQRHALHGFDAPGLLPQGEYVLEGFAKTIPFRHWGCHIPEWILIH